MMLMRPRFAGLFATVLVPICACILQPADAGGDPCRGLAPRILSASRPDSTAVLVLFDEDAAEGLRPRLPQSFKVVPFRHPHRDARNRAGRVQLPVGPEFEMACLRVVPEAYAEAVVGIRNQSDAAYRPSPNARLALCCGVATHGVEARASFGYVVGRDAPYAGLEVRALTIDFGF